MRSTRFFLIIWLTLPLYCNGVNKDSITVLFIGNSYTYLNGLPGILDSIAITANKKVVVDQTAQPGFSFYNHTKSDSSLSIIKKRKWDYVILQERGSLISNGDEKNEKYSYQYADKLDSVIRINSPEAQLISFLSWVPKMGNPTIQGDNFDSALVRLGDGYRSLAKRLNAMVSDIGYAWQQSIKKNPEMNLWHKDQVHSNLKGSYLAACVLYKTIFGGKLEKINFNSRLDSETAVFLRKIADQSGSSH